MASRRLTHADYGLKGRNTVEGMLVTAANKMKDGTKLRVGFAGTIPESVVLPVDQGTAEHNLGVLDRFVGLLDRRRFPTSRKSATATILWGEVDGATVADAFFGSLRTPESAWKVNAQMIAGYIRNR